MKVLSAMYTSFSARIQAMTRCIWNVRIFVYKTFDHLLELVEAVPVSKQ